MKAAHYERKGPPDVLRLDELAEPEPGQVRVRVHASGVNPSDTKQRRGKAYASASDEPSPMPFPRVVPHNDGAGVIDKVGAGVSSRRLGERVWIYEAQLGRPFGTAAEYVAVPKENAVTLPDHVGFAEGACLGVPAMTAHRCVLRDGPVAGQTVLVTGGTGAVGYYAVQLAKLHGAQVVVTVGSDEQADVAREAGADLAVSYKDGAWGERALAFAGSPDDRGGFDRVVDVAFGSNVETVARLLKPNGVIATYASDAEPEPKLPFYPLLLNGGATLQINLVYAVGEAAHRSAIRDIGAALARGALRHRIGRQLPLERIAEAHDAVESGAGGKAVLEIA